MSGRVGTLCDNQLCGAPVSCTENEWDGGAKDVFCSEACAKADPNTPTYVIGRRRVTVHAERHRKQQERKETFRVTWDLLWAHSLRNWR